MQTDTGSTRSVCRIRHTNPTTRIQTLTARHTPSAETHVRYLIPNTRKCDQSPWTLSALGMKRAPCYKTIQNTIQYLTERVPIGINQQLIPQTTLLGDLDNSGIKTHRRDACIVLRFRLHQHRRDFKKIHLFVDLVSKKI